MKLEIIKQEMMELSGIEFKHHFPGPYYKVVKYYGLNQYIKGCIIENFSFSKNDDFCFNIGPPENTNNGNTILTIDVANDAKVIIENNKVYANKFIITDVQTTRESKKYKTMFNLVIDVFCYTFGLS